MAEKTVGFGASDLFAMSANFHEQSSSSILNDTMATTRDALGNYECETSGLNSTTEYSNSFVYCGSDLVSDLGTALTQFGDVFDSKKMTGLTINFTAGQQPTVEISGHQHAENAHEAGTPGGYADISGALAGVSTGFGVPIITGQLEGTNATPASLTFTCACDHIDTEGEDGNHWVGKNIAFKVEMSETWTATPTTPLPTSWTQDSAGANDSNAEFDGYTFNAHIYFDAATA